MKRTLLLFVRLSREITNLAYFAAIRGTCVLFPELLLSDRDTEAPYRSTGLPYCNPGLQFLNPELPYRDPKAPYCDPEVQDCDTGVRDCDTANGGFTK